MKFQIDMAACKKEPKDEEPWKVSFQSTREDSGQILTFAGSARAFNLQLAEFSDIMQQMQNIITKHQRTITNQSAQINRLEASRLELKTSIASSMCNYNLDEIAAPLLC